MKTAYVVFVTKHISIMMISFTSWCACPCSWMISATLRYVKKKVENTVYKIHKRVLVASASCVFRDMFSMPPGPERREGEIEDDPISLEGTSVLEFDALLSMLYTRYVLGSLRSHLISSLFSS